MFINSSYVLLRAVDAGRKKWHAPTQKATSKMLVPANLPARREIAAFLGATPKKLANSTPPPLSWSWEMEEAGLMPTRKTSISPLVMPPRVPPRHVFDQRWPVG